FHNPWADRRQPTTTAATRRSYRLPGSPLGSWPPFSSECLPADPLRTQPGARYPLYPASLRLPPPSRRRTVRTVRRTIITILLAFIPALLPLLPAAIAAAVLVALRHSCSSEGDVHHHP